MTHKNTKVKVVRGERSQGMIIDKVLPKDNSPPMAILISPAEVSNHRSHPTLPFAISFVFVRSLSRGTEEIRERICEIIMETNLDPLNMVIH